MDALSDVLKAVRLSGAVYFDIHASEPWVAETPAGRSVVAAMFPGSEHLISYHVLLGGTCWATIEGHEPIQLSAGDVIVFPHGDTHVLSSVPGLSAKPNMSMYRRQVEGVFPATIAMGKGSAVSANFVCGFLGCDARPFNPLLAALPRVIRVSDDASGTLGSYVKFALAESKLSRIGGESVLSRLSELMFLHVVRRYLETLPADKADWLSGLRDQPVGRALAALHRKPARAWTLQTLAREAGISRSVLAERFTKFVGYPPIEYLTNWRMQLAANQLRGSTASVVEVANDVGYESEAAFSRAFKKAVGAPPSEWRKSRASAGG